MSHSRWFAASRTDATSRASVVTPGSSTRRGQAVECADAREEAVLDLDADELRELAQFARAMGEAPTAAVDRAVRAALAELALWEAELAELGELLVAAEPERPELPSGAADVGRELDGRLHRARAALLAAVCEYHHGGSGPGPGTRPW
ncbi:hypothetical protein [Kitasatospora sp. NPDC059160]|uniref:hypothetical protein n=1 Tax=Kitasatospora sp. NPDC059160 TaxID=3346748 RepID=UPI0036A30DCF